MRLITRSSTWQNRNAYGIFKHCQCFSCLMWFSIPFVRTKSFNWKEKESERCAMCFSFCFLFLSGQKLSEREWETYFSLLISAQKNTFLTYSYFTWQIAWKICFSRFGNFSFFFVVSLFYRVFLCKSFTLSTSNAFKSRAKSCPKPWRENRN